jgi:hypothetical protein
MHAYDRGISTQTLPSVAPQVRDTEVTWVLGEPISSTVEVKVSYDAKLKSRVVEGPSFKLTFQKGVGTFSEGSRLYAGATFPVVSSTSTGRVRLVAPSGEPEIPAGVDLLLRSDLDWARDIALYQLIDQAREVGAEALLEPSYDWKLTEQGTYRSGIMGEKPVTATKTYQLTAFSKLVFFQPVQPSPAQP